MKPCQASAADFDGVYAYVTFHRYGLYTLNLSCSHAVRNDRDPETK